MDNFLDKHHLPKLNQDKISKLNIHVSVKEIETVIKSLPTKKSPGPDGFQAEFNKPFKKELITILLKMFHNIETERILPNAFFEATIILIPSPHKDITKKENYRPISLMNIDAKILNKKLANWIQEHIRKIINRDQVSFILEMQSLYMKICQCNLLYKQTGTKDHFIRFLKSLWQNTASLHDKVLEKAGIQGTYLNIIKAIYTSQHQTKWRETQSNHTEIPKIYKELKKLVIKRTNNPIKMGYRPKQELSTEESKMGERHWRKCSTSLAIREMQIKTTLRFHLTLVRKARIKNTDDNSCWRGCGVKGTFPYCWGSENWYSYFGYHNGNFSEN